MLGLREGLGQLADSQSHLGNLAACTVAVLQDTSHHGVPGGKMSGLAPRGFASTARPALTADERMPAPSVRPFTNELWMAQETTGSRALTLHPVVHADTLRVPINSSAL
jgi:hypothetical protein